MSAYVWALICNLSIPLVLAICGICEFYFSPKKINNVYGFRTELSMKNQELWDLAQKLCGNLFLKISLIFLIIDVLCFVIIRGFSDNVIYVFALILMFIQIVSLIVSLFNLDKKLKG